MTSTTPFPGDPHEQLGALAATLSWFDTSYDVRTGIDGTVVSSGSVLTGVRDPERAADAVVSWAHEHDAHTDSRIDPTVEVSDLTEVDADDILDRLLDLADQRQHLRARLIDAAAADAIVVSGIDSDDGPAVNVAASTT